MSKRTAADPLVTSSEGQAFTKVPPSQPKREQVENSEIGEFEDAWEDEIESDEEVVDGGTEDSEDEEEDEDGMEVLCISLDHRITHDRPP